MWRLAPGYGFGLIKGTKFSTIPSGYSINVISPYGFNIGPFITIYLIRIWRFESDNMVNVDNDEIITSDSLLPLKPLYIGIGGDLNFFESIYTEGHIGKLGLGLVLEAF